jgi:hypothetical protein
MPTSSQRRLTRVLRDDRDGDLRAAQKRSIAESADAPQDQSPAHSNLSRARSESSIDTSRARTAAALGVPCSVHVADVGQSCSRGVRGYCVDRLARGLDVHPVYFQLRSDRGRMTVKIRESIGRSAR